MENFLFHFNQVYYYYYFCLIKAALTTINIQLISVIIISIAINYFIFMCAHELFMSC